MDGRTRGDVAPLTGAHGVPAGSFVPPCSTSDTGTGTLKCEACPGGCQIYNDSSVTLGLANERAYFPRAGGGGAGGVSS